jgi:hypothetical protein
MLTVHLSCPCCSRNLRCQRLIAPGERLRCPKCGSWFRAGSLSETGTATAPRRGKGILLAWLVFISFLLLSGGSIAVLASLGNRAKPQGDDSVRWAESSRPTSAGVVGLEDSTHPTPTTPTTPVAPAAAAAPPPSRGRGGPRRLDPPYTDYTDDSGCSCRSGRSSAEQTRSFSRPVAQSTSRST